jgi:hypothetical protein
LPSALCSAGWLSVFPFLLVVCCESIEETNGAEMRIPERQRKNRRRKRHEEMRLMQKTKSSQKKRKITTAQKRNERGKGRINPPPTPASA